MSYFRASSIPTWNTFDEFFLCDVNKVPLIHINGCHYRWLVGQGDQLDSLLETGILETEAGQQVAVLHVEDVERVVDLVRIIANDVMLIAAHHNLMGIHMLDTILSVMTQI